MTFKPYPTYKDSGVEWLGKVPEGWALKPIKAISTCNDNVLTDSTTEDLEIEYVEISGVNAEKGIFETALIPFSEAPSRARRCVQDGDVIVSTVRTYLRAIAPVKQPPPPNLIVSTGFAVIRPQKINSNFLGFLFLAEFLIAKIIAHSVGVSYPAINASDLMVLKIPLPPLPEQETIAAFLDHETTRIDALIAAQHSLIALLKEKRQALISHAVTRGLDPTVKLKDSGVEWLGMVPEGWVTHSLKYCAEDGRKKFTDGDWVESPYITDNGVRLIQTGNVGIGEYRDKGFKYISDNSFESLNCTEIKPNDILICRLDGPVGRACIVPNLGLKMITSVDNTILKLNKKFDPRFLVYVMCSSPWLDWIQNLCRVGGGFRFRISRTMLGDQQIPAPPRLDQIQIADFLDSETAKIDTLIAEAQKGIELLKERRSALISAAVTGQIDVRDWQAPEVAA